MLWFGKQKFFNYYLPSFLSLVLIVVAGFFWLGSQTARATISRLNHITAICGGNCTTGGIVTSGATLLTITGTANTTSQICSTPSDSNNNNWHALTRRDGGNASVCFFYAYDSGSGSPLVTSATATHTATMSGAFVSVVFTAWTGTLTTGDPLETSAGNTSTGSSTVAPGSVTPLLNNELVITTEGNAGSACTSSVNNGTLIISDNVNWASGSNMGTTIAYVVQTASATVNPTWTCSGSAGMGSIIAVFKSGKKSGNFVEQGGKFRQRGGKVIIK